MFGCHVRHQQGEILHHLLKTRYCHIAHNRQQPTVCTHSIYKEIVTSDYQGFLTEYSDATHDITILQL